MSVWIKLNLFCVLTVLFNIETHAISSKDTLLVYFSHNRSVNSLYSEFIKLKFPDMEVINIENMEEFNTYIPKHLYQNRTATFGNGNMSAVDRFLKEKGMNFKADELIKVYQEEQNSKSRDSVLTPSPEYHPGSFYFFDVRSMVKTETYYVTEGNMQVQRRRSFLEHHLELVHYQQQKLSSVKVLKLWMNEGNYYDTIVKLYEMDKASDWINPVLIGLYLKESIGNKIFKPEVIHQPCDMVKKTDTIYICQILDKENLYGSLGGHADEFLVPHQVKFFMHTHYRENNHEFARSALNSLHKGTSFYFYFYAMELNCFYIVDANTMEVVYFQQTKPYLQPKKLVKKFSEFNKKCKS